MLEAACFDCGKYRTDMVHLAHLCRDCPSFAQHGLAVSLVQSTPCPYWRLKAVPVWHWNWLRDTLWPWRVPQEVLKVVLVFVHVTSCFAALVPLKYKNSQPYVKQVWQYIQPVYWLNYRFWLWGLRKYVITRTYCRHHTMYCRYHTSETNIDNDDNFEHVRIDKRPWPKFYLSHSTTGWLPVLCKWWKSIALCWSCILLWKAYTKKCYSPATCSISW